VAEPSFAPLPSRARRPVSLTFSLVLVWLIGLGGATDGCQTIDTLQDPVSAQAIADRVSDPRVQLMQESLIRAVLGFRHLAAPLAAGAVVLGSLLTFTAALTLLGRGRARRVLVQAIVAYAAFLPIQYAVRAPIRATIIDVVATSAPLPVIPDMTPNQVQDNLRALYWWMSRGVLAAQLATLAIALFVMTRPRVRAFFASASLHDPRDGL
jgi:hypothetical protein